MTVIDKLQYQDWVAGVCVVVMVIFYVRKYIKDSNS